MNSMIIMAFFLLLLMAATANARRVLSPSRFRQRALVRTGRASLLPLAPLMAPLQSSGSSRASAVVGAEGINERASSSEEEPRFAVPCGDSIYSRDDDVILVIRSGRSPLQQL